MARRKKSEVAEVQETKVQDSKEMKVMRANRITVVTKDELLVGRFFLTHKLVAEINQTECGWQPIEDAKATANRESFRGYLIKHANDFGVDWSPAKQTQAWDRKYNKYYEFSEVEEDTKTLITPLIERLVEKCKYELTLDKIEVTEIVPKPSNLEYVEDGRYSSSGAWCVGDILVNVEMLINEHSFLVELEVNMKSGQICKPKLTIAQFEGMVTDELELRGIEVEVA